ncbi:hypothetical protein AAMO2058_000732000 [Amorphochlora amoebiformis]
MDVSDVMDDFLSAIGLTMLKDPLSQEDLKEPSDLANISLEELNEFMLTCGVKLKLGQKVRLRKAWRSITETGSWTPPNHTEPKPKPKPTPGPISEPSKPEAKESKGDEKDESIVYIGKCKIAGRQGYLRLPFSEKEIEMQYTQRRKTMVQFELPQILRDSTGRISGEIAITPNPPEKSNKRKKENKTAPEEKGSPSVIFGLMVPWAPNHPLFLSTLTDAKQKESFTVDWSPLNGDHLLLTTETNSSQNGIALWLNLRFQPIAGLLIKPLMAIIQPHVPKPIHKPPQIQHRLEKA